MGENSGGGGRESLCLPGAVPYPGGRNEPVRCLTRMYEDQGSKEGTCKEQNWGGEKNNNVEGEIQGQQGRKRKSLGVTHLFQGVLDRHLHLDVPG